MTQRRQESAEQPEAKPGVGVDRSQIRRLLALTPQERLEVFVASARNVAQFVASARVV
jgi:hypothetical protein